MDEQQNLEKNTKILAAWKQFQARLRKIRKEKNEQHHEVQHAVDQKKIDDLRKQLH